MYIRTIDIAHPPLSSSDAEDVLNQEAGQIRLSQKWRVLKVIHGYGAVKGNAVLKEVVRNWGYRQKQHIRAFLPGEEYSLFNTVTQEMRKSCGQGNDPDLGKSNPGITLIWIK